VTSSIILAGGPDSGKTNYVGRVWPALDSGTGGRVPGGGVGLSVAELTGRALTK
jgi:hypothetical protein